MAAKQVRSDVSGGARAKTSRVAVAVEEAYLSQARLTGVAGADAEEEPADDIVDGDDDNDDARR